jgi:hypothetical protein
LELENQVWDGTHKFGDDQRFYDLRASRS